jgi:hypothetical protein
MYGALRVSRIPNEYFRTRPNPSDEIELPSEAPLSARTKIDAPTSFRIPRGSLIQWLPRPSDGFQMFDGFRTTTS